jgi:hypothetical protein
MCPIVAAAQVKVAEGEYALQEGSKSGAASTKTVTAWSLFDNATGYHLISEIHVPSSEQRVVQIEDLNPEMVPMSVGYEIYAKGQDQPGAAIKCRFVADTVTCSGQSHGVVVISKPFKHSGPFWFWVSDLFALDTSWLLDGAINMAQLYQGKAPLTMISVSPGEGQELEISAEPEGTLELLGTEKIEVVGTKVDSKHYILKDASDGPIEAWVANGLLLKLHASDKSDFVLTNYKQYKKIMPEFVIEQRPARGAKSTGESPGQIAAEQTDLSFPTTEKKTVRMGGR